MSETLRPRGQRIVVKEHEAVQTTTASGIVIQRFEPKKLRSGTVLSVGHNCPGIEVGDTVHYRRECGTPWRDNQLILQYDMIEAVGDGDVLTY